MSEAIAKAKLRGVYDAWKAEEVEAADLIDAVAEYLDRGHAHAVADLATVSAASCGKLPPKYALQGKLQGCTGCTLPLGHAGKSHQDTTTEHGWIIWEEACESGCCAPGDVDHCISFLHDKPHGQTSATA